MCKDTCSAIPQLQNMVIFCTNYPYTQTWALYRGEDSYKARDYVWGYLLCYATQL